jgi:hypothetical protein
MRGGGGREIDPFRALFRSPLHPLRRADPPLQPPVVRPEDVLELHAHRRHLSRQHEDTWSEASHTQAAMSVSHCRPSLQRQSGLRIFIVDSR